MRLKDFGKRLTTREREDFCRLAETSSAYLSQCMSGHRRPSSTMAQMYVRASKQLFPDSPEKWLTLEGLRPDIWGRRAAALLEAAPDD